MDAPSSGSTVSGRRLVIPILILVALSVGLVVAYKTVHTGTEARLQFTRLVDGDVGNATTLSSADVRNSDLDEHLNTAFHSGNSTAASFRAEELIRFFDSRFGHLAPWLVAWKGAVIQVSPA
ncbi:MAG: hypothetical protein AABX89_06030 [Candidatus Thermoplasmatota archaeon]